VIEASLPAPEAEAETAVASPVLATIEQLRSVQAEAAISKHVALAAGTGFIPFPIFDVVATTGVQADLLWNLFKIYGQEISKERARSVVTVLLGASVPSLAARSVSSGLKLVPGIGTALSFFTSPSLAGASTYVVGKVVQEHLAGGGTALDLQFSKAKAKVAEELNKIKTRSGEAVDKLKAKSSEVVTGIKTKSGEAIGEGKTRVGNVVLALQGKKFPAEEQVPAAG
jgi:uncharacterized protein (DUF697 family)